MLARTSGRRTTPTVRLGALEIDTDLMRAHYAGHRVHLSRPEFALLAQLCEAPRRVWAKPELLKSVWGFENPTEARHEPSTARLPAAPEAPRRRRRAPGHQPLGVGYALTTTNNDGNDNGDGGEAA